MERRDNYRIQAAQAKEMFLGYDQEAIIRKLKLPADEAYLYPRFLGSTYRICRRTADFRRLKDGVWVDANTHGEVMTLLDLLCDSREDRFLAHRWQNMLAFGHRFHQQLMEDADPNALRFQADLEGFRRACLTLGGKPLPQGDAAYAIEVFDTLPIAVQLWLGDEEFPPQLRWMWDENALMYLKYETMYFARGVLLQRIREEMER